MSSSFSWIHEVQQQDKLYEQQAIQNQKKLKELEKQAQTPSTVQRKSQSSSSSLSTSSNSAPKIDPKILAKYVVKEKIPMHVQPQQERRVTKRTKDQPTPEQMRQKTKENLKLLHQTVERQPKDSITYTTVGKVDFGKTNYNKSSPQSDIRIPKKPKIVSKNIPPSTSTSIPSSKPLPSKNNIEDFDDLLNESLIERSSSNIPSIKKNSIPSKPISKPISTDIYHSSQKQRQPSSLPTSSLSTISKPKSISHSSQSNPKPLSKPLPKPLPKPLSKPISKPISKSFTNHSMPRPAALQSGNKRSFEQMQEEENEEDWDEYEEDGFIDDSEDAFHPNPYQARSNMEMRKLMQAIRRGRRHYEEDEEEDDMMEAGWDEMEEENRKSKRIGNLEDMLEEKREEERVKAKMLRKKSKT